MNKTNILTVSIIAMMAVGSVRADIASTNYVNAQIQPVSQALAGKQATIDAEHKLPVGLVSGAETTSNKVDGTDTTIIQDSEHTDWDKYYPSMAAADALVSQKFTGLDLANSYVQQVKSGDKTALVGRDSAGNAGKVALTDLTFTSTGSGNRALSVNKAGAVASGNTGIVTGGAVYNAIDAMDVSTFSGEGNVVTAVTQTDGKISVTKGTTLGSLATKNEVAKSDLASGVQTSLDAADSALPAATYNAQIGTVSAANMGSTATTVVGAISEINDTTNTASLKSRIGKAEGDISQLGTQISTLTSDSQVKSTADYQVGKQGGGWTTLDTNQVAAINSGATSALVGKISTNEAAINTLNGSGAGSVANSIASALTSYSTTAQMNTELAKKQNTIDNDHKLATNLIATSSDAQFVTASEKSTWSGKQDALTAGDRITITTDAQTGNLVISAADQSYSDTALSNRVTAIEDSAAYKSGIDSTKVAQIATNASNISTLQSGKQDKIDAQHKLSTDLIANDAGFITKDVNNLTNYTTTTNMNTALAGKQPVSSGVSVGGTGGTWNSLTNGSGITITTSNGTTTIATAKAYVPMPSAAGTTGKSVLTYDSEANAGAGAYYWEEIGR